jgi:hypothetical protein
MMREEPTEKQARYLCSDVRQFPVHVSIECKLDVTSAVWERRLNKRKETINCDHDCGGQVSKC